MALPVSQRAVFRRNPLYTVSAQIRFPPILRINSEPPVALQERLRAEFPGYRVVAPMDIPLPNGVPPEVQSAVRAAMQGGIGLGPNKAHQFLTADGNWTAQLASEALTVSCKQYPKWEIFRAKVESVWQLFVELYRPPFSTALGLRYQNAIDRSKLDLERTPWNELLASWMVGEFGCPGIREEDVASDLHRFELLLDGGDRIFVQHGVAKNQATNQPVYAIDNNFSSPNKVELSDVFKRLDQLNSHSGSLFRVCITDKLYASLDPIEA